MSYAVVLVNWYDGSGMDYWDVGEFENHFPQFERQTHQGGYTHSGYKILEMMLMCRECECVIELQKEEKVLEE